MDTPGEVIYAAETQAVTASPRASAVALPIPSSFVELNRAMEAKFRRGEIDFKTLDWHLRTLCGI